MAAAKSSDDVVAECGYCLRRGSSLVNPKLLPCSHVHCKECLAAFCRTNGIVRCPICSEVFDVKLKDLPSTGSAEDHILDCDVCMKRGVENQLAITFCTACSKKYCDKHKESHDEVMDDHPQISIKEYHSERNKLQIRTCARHNDQQFILSCQTCCDIYCGLCIPGLESCLNGFPHELISLNELIDMLVKKSDEIKSEVLVRKETLSAFSKKTSQIIADYESETAELVANIHRARNEQIQAITEKYRKLENELKRGRTQTMESMAGFMSNVDIKLFELNSHHLRMEASFKDNHKVDIVKAFRSTETLISELVKEAMPILELNNMAVLATKEECRNIELTVEFTDSRCIKSDHEAVISEPTSPRISPPTTSKLIRSVNVYANCYTVTSYQRNAYVGLQNTGVARIDEKYQLYKPYVALKDPVYGITAYKGRIYALVYNSSQLMVTVHDTSKQYVTSWNHTDMNRGTNSLTIVDDRVVIPDRLNKRLIIYSLTGEIIKHIPCPQLGTKWCAICAVGDDSVVVSDHGSSLVFRVNISSEEVLWTSSYIEDVNGVTCYGRSCVLVASKDGVHVLNVKTGGYISLIAGDANGGRDAYDLSISGQTLIMPRSSQKKILFYQLD